MSTDGIVGLIMYQVRLSTAVWLWTLQLGALLLMSVGQQFQGTGGSEIHPLVQVLLFFSIFGVIALGIALEVSIILMSGLLVLFCLTPSGECEVEKSCQSRCAAADFPDYFCRPEPGCTFAGYMTGPAEHLANFGNVSMCA